MSIAPGTMTFTAIRLAASSEARERANEADAALLAAYAGGAK